MTHRRRHGDRRGVDVDIFDDLSPTDHRVVMLAREALGSTIERFAPKGSSQLTIAAIAVSGLFVDLVGTLSAAPELVATVNEHLALAGWRLTTVARN
jgi:hypothetical protein